MTADLTIETAVSTQVAIGRMISICIKQQAYMDWNLWDLERLFIPPVEYGQYRLFRYNSDDIGFFTWAQLSKNVSDYLVKYAADPRHYEWNSGGLLWIIDMVADVNFSSQMALAIQRRVFTPEFRLKCGIDDTVKANALRRYKDKSIRKVARFSFKK